MSAPKPVPLIALHQAAARELAPVAQRMRDEGWHAELVARTEATRWTLSLEVDLSVIHPPSGSEPEQEKGERMETTEGTPEVPAEEPGTEGVEQPAPETAPDQVADPETGESATTEDAGASDGDTSAD